jgi:hypothetical protein
VNEYLKDNPYKVAKIMARIFLGSVWGYISIARKNAINTFNEKRLTKGM